jgi:predicted nucleic acid-binding protein
MILLDTSVVIPCLRRDGPAKLERLVNYIAGADYFIPHFAELELLQAARIRYDMARVGLTVQSAIDCCIAQMTIERGLMLVHQDHDYALIARVRPLTHHFLDLSSAS